MQDLPSLTFCISLNIYIQTIFLADGCDYSVPRDKSYKLDEDGKFIHKLNCGDSRAVVDYRPNNTFLNLFSYLSFEPFFVTPDAPRAYNKAISILN